VAGALQRHAHRAEPVAEQPHARLEHVESSQSVPRQLRGELEAGRRLLRPAAELVLGGEPVARRVQLDGAEPLRVVAEELGPLRRLFLEEFADSVPEVPPIEGSEGKRAADLYERIFLGYGDDSVAQLGGAHIACEWTSNLLTKILQRPRLASYLEQSTRYIAYDTQLEGFGYRYYRDARFGAQYEHALDDLFGTYSGLLDGMSTWVAEQFPRGDDESAAAHTRAVRAKALDLVRGL